MSPLLNYKGSPRAAEILSYNCRVLAAAVGEVLNYNHSPLFSVRQGLNYTDLDLNLHVVASQLLNYMDLSSDWREVLRCMDLILAFEFLNQS